MAKSAGANRRNDENKINPGIKITLIVVAVLCVVMLVYTAVDALGIIDRSTTAMTVGEDKISVTELNQYYRSTRSSFLNENAYMLSMYGYDLTSGTFDLQTCLYDSSMTWKDYLMKQAQNIAKEVSLLYQEANANGYEMSADDQEQYDQYMQSLEEAAEEYGVSTSKYCKLLYGSGTRLSDVESYYQKRVYTAGYYNTVVEGFGIDDAAVRAYYEENADDYDEMNYYLYSVKYDTFTYDADSTEEGAPTSEEEAEKMTEEAKEAARQEAEALMARMNGTGADFDSVCAAADEEFTTGKTQTVVSSLSEDSDIGAWLLESGRKAGDLTVAEDENSSAMCVLLYEGREENDDYTVAVRHCLIAFETAETDATEEEVAAVETANEGKKTEAEALYAEWKAGDATEESFIAMTQEHSADNADEGGLYTGVYQGQMVTAFNDWCFDESRKPGDTDIVESEYGYHIMYFVENEGLSYLTDIRDTLESEKYEEYLTGLESACTITYNNTAIDMM